MPGNAVSESVSSATWGSRWHQQFKCLTGVPERFICSAGHPQISKTLHMLFWTLNFVGIFIFFIGLCVLESSINTSSTGLLWWTLLFHCAVCASRLLGRSSDVLQVSVDLRPLLCISGVLLMLTCDRAAQLQSAKGKVGTSASAVLAGSVITLFGYLPLLVNKTAACSSQNLGRRNPRSLTSRSPSFNPAGSKLPDMSAMEEGQSGATESGMSQFKSYSNPYAVVEDSNEEHIEPALKPNSGYPRPPRDLPPSPPPAARVCTAGQPSQPVVAGGSTQETHTSLASKSKSHVSHRETTFALKPTQLEPHSPAKTPASTSSDNIQLHASDGQIATGEQATDKENTSSGGVTENTAPAAPVEHPVQKESKLESNSSWPQKHTPPQQSTQAINDGKSFSSTISTPSSLPTYARIPSVTLGTGVRAAGFLNQGESEDSDG